MEAIATGYGALAKSDVEQAAYSHVGDGEVGAELAIPTETCFFVDAEAMVAVDTK